MPLYLIEILHQTTTSLCASLSFWSCILSKFYIKPQLATHGKRKTDRCILSKFYIKPQQSTLPAEQKKVVSYRNSTSNHNIGAKKRMQRQVVSYRNSTSNHNYFTECSHGGRVVSYRNSTSNHNSDNWVFSEHVVVSYRNSTSNHNIRRTTTWISVLYLIEILHQTTTYGRQRVPQKCCILSKFYIKPQLLNFSDSSDCVVSYRNSTSNHNERCRRIHRDAVVSYRNSTSNHNRQRRRLRLW